jgi:hypothetical protein
VKQAEPIKILRQPVQSAPKTITNQIIQNRILFIVLGSEVMSKKTSSFIPDTRSEIIWIISASL